MFTPDDARVASSEAETVDFSVPKNACDCHFHIFGPYSRFPLSPRSVFTPEEASYQACLAMHKKLGIERGVLVHSGAHGMDLGASINALQANSNWRGVALIEPTVSEANLSELKDTGFVGARLNFADRIAVPEMIHQLGPIFKRVGWHLEMLLSLDALVDLADEIERSEVPCVVDHMGYTPSEESIEHPGFQALLRLVSKQACWVKLSGADRMAGGTASFAGAKPYMDSLVDANPDQLVWGSDWPHVRVETAPSDIELLNTFGAWVSDDVIRRKILADNPARLYGFGAQNA